MLRKCFFILPFVFIHLVQAQPDSLFIPENGNTVAYPVTYPPLPNGLEPFLRVGKYAFDTTRTAVTINYKRGKPSGIYRAFYPNGKQLIFAVYGWGSLHGDWTEYGPDGHIAVKGQYRMGKRDGTWAFRDQGIVGHYKHGLKNGKWKYYTNGQLVKREKWRKGKLQQGGTFLFGL